MVEHNGEDRYYEARSLFNRLGNSARKAALFIYLNRTCFNGIWRVSRSGDFNVPHGRVSQPQFPSKEDLEDLSCIFENSRLLFGDFESTVKSANDGDFVYLDPPYPPLNGIANFTHYTAGRFSGMDQRDLAGHVRRLDASGTRFLMTNADTVMVRRLYRGFRIASLDVVRSVTCKKVRHKVSEVVICNY